MIQSFEQEHDDAATIKSLEDSGAQSHTRLGPRFVVVEQRPAPGGGQINRIVHDVDGAPRGRSASKEPPRSVA